MLSMRRVFTIIGFSFLIAILAIVAFTSWYTVDESEQAVMITLGEVEEGVSEPGLHFKYPWPIQSVEILSKETFSLQFGYEESEDGDVKDFPKETKMITGDENIVLADMVVQWKITDPGKYLFNAENPTEMLEDATSASLRSIIGSSTIDDALTSGKVEIEKQVQELLSTLIGEYDIGISILAVKLQDVDLPNEEVRKAFTNVTDARETMNTRKNEANKYRNKRTEEAQGEKDAIMSAAQGDKAARMEVARGDVAQFNAIYNEYKNAKDITQKRLVLETIDQVLPNAEIYIMEDNGNTMKYLPIKDSITKPVAPVEQEGSEGEGSETNGQ
ncbi:FtsH protease activity modulator HflK [Metabacillus bambusae]|uniref:Protein HflK n=1 Tax=Metabacillus bambusae TaxID=2795218 RepID=A0ABS3N7I1_9BACI|nr:FtsH protease activity modulator HflK [Metabacillus bambusae]MBO1514252.1 FtsH protease activity modulator HflK [Metabacillus bambusae]